MKLIPPKLGPTESNSGKTDAGRQVHRRIEITVEREIVSVLVKGRPESGAADQAWDRAGPESEPVQLIQAPTDDSEETSTIHPPAPPHID